HPDLAAAARAAGLDVRTGRLPDDLVVPPGWADAVLLLDVIEHLDDDVAALETARRALRPGGLLVITVPAYRWLWSGHDVALGHRRRYSARGLARLVERAGLHVVHASYFNTLLFPAVALTRAWKRLTGDESHDLHRPAPAINRWLERVFALERHVVPRVALPLGVGAVYGLAHGLGGATEGVVAALVFATAPFVVFASLHFQLDLPLASMVALMLVVLLRIDAFEHRGWSVAAGIVLGLGMLTKPPFAAYVLAPLALAAARIRSRRAVTNLILALLIGGALSLPWYGPRVFSLVPEIT